jgi:hypothetical protein
VNAPQRHSDISPLKLPGRVLPVSLPRSGTVVDDSVALEAFRAHRLQRILHACRKSIHYECASKLQDSIGFNKPWNLVRDQDVEEE